MNDLVLTPDELAIGKRAQAALLASAGAAAPRPHPWARPATAKPAPVAGPLPPRAPSERALTGALLQDADAVWPLADAAGIEAEAFTDSDCLRIWRAAAVLRHQGKPVDMVAIAESMGGDAGDNVQIFSELIEDCPTSAYASRYVEQVAENQRRRKLSDAARMAAEALAKGGAVDVVADALKAATEAVGGGGSGPQIVSALDFLAEPIPEPPKVIHNVLRAEQVGMMSASSKVGKSWLLLMLSNAVASGLPWLRWPTTQGRVLYINAELSRFDLHQRLESIADAMDLPGIPPLLDIWHMKGTRRTIGQLIPAIVERQRGAGRYSLVVPDPLYSFNGDREENSNTEMAVTMGELSELTERTGAGCWISHHFSKGGQSGKSHLDRGSGAGVLARSPDTILTMTEHGEADCYSVETTCRSFAKPEPFVVRWQYPLWQIASGLDPSDLKRAKSGRGPQFTPGQIVELLPDDGEGIRHKEWMEKAGEEIGIKPATFNTLLRSAKDRKMVRCDFGKYLRDPGFCGDILSAQTV